MWFPSLLSLFLLAAGQASAQAGFSQSSFGLQLILSIPEEAAKSQSGDIFFNVTAPASGWSAVGMGASMDGSLVFIIWPSGNDVVVSSRIAHGHTLPTYYEDAGVKVLDGSKVEGGVMTAVFSCSNCWSWSSGEIGITNSRRPWIYSQNTQTSVTSSSVRASFVQHTDMGTTTVDMTKAVLASSATSGSNSSPSGGSSGGGFTSGGMPAITTDQNIDSGLTKFDKILIAHGTLMSVSFLFLFPFGVSIIRFLSSVVPSAVWTHAGFQIMTWFIVVIGFGMGYWMANLTFTHWVDKHQIFGAVIVWLFTLQILFGLWHHAYFKQHKRRGLPSYMHLFFGRSLMLCGVINGGFGLDLAAAPRPWIIAYAVIAAVVYISLIFGVTLKEIQRFARGRRTKGSEASSS